MATITKLLVCLDGSPAGEVLVREAIAVAKHRKVKITLLYVNPTLPLPWGETCPPSASEEVVRQVFSTHPATLKRRGIAHETIVREGAPATEILAQATAMKARLIIVGHHGMSRVERIVMGSVATQVVAQAPCSVLVVRVGSPEPL